MTFVIRSATQTDITALATFEATPTIRAFVAEVDGKPVALGGVAWQDGRWIGFCDITSAEAKSHRIAVARAAKRFIAQMAHRNTRFIYAKPDPDEPGAVRWLTSLGFSPDTRTHGLYRWSKSE